MPWSERTRMDERIGFVGQYLSGVFRMSELCALRGISRVTGYKWIRRYRLEGARGLLDRSRAAHHCPHRMSEPVRAALLEQRRMHPTWGPRKLLARLRRTQPKLTRPSRSAVAALLKREGLVKRTYRKRAREAPAASAPLVAPAQANATWSIDFKGQFRTGDGRYCFPLTVQDVATRYLLGCQGQLSTAAAPVRALLEQLFAEHGLPQAIRSDNGTPFVAAAGTLPLTRLTVWLLKLGITLQRIQPGHPEQNGRHERMHRVLKAETARPPAATLRAQQRRFDRFRIEYNELRPHEALADRTPTEFYRTSPRAYRLAQARKIDYPAHLERRRVAANGRLFFNGRAFFLSEALAGETLALEEIDDALWSIYLADRLIARLDERRILIAPAV